MSIGTKQYETIRSRTIRLAREFGLKHETFTAKELSEYIGDIAGRRYQPHQSNVSAVLGGLDEFTSSGSKRRLWSMKSD